jgi:hypothetical protein
LKIEKPPGPKMQFITPTKKTVGRVVDLTGRRKDIVTGTDWGSVIGEFAGAGSSESGFAIFRGVKTQFSVPVDQPFSDPPKSYKALIRGIPAWLDQTQVYYHLLMYLAKFHLLMVSGVEFVDDTNEYTKAAWIVIDGTEEATRILDAQNFRLSFNAYQVFQLPKTIALSSNEVTLVAYENA